MSNSLNRRLGRELTPHIDVALDLIGQAIESQGAGDLKACLGFWERARVSLSESSSWVAPICRQSCDLAIERLARAIAGEKNVDLTVCLRPDLGQTAAKRHQQERADAAKLEAARRQKIAQYNQRRHGDDIKTIEKAIEAITTLRPKSGARPVFERLRSDLLCGLQRGITPEQWKYFADACRREGIPF